MKSPRHLFVSFTVSLVLGCVVVLPLALGATSNTNTPGAKGKTAPATNAANAIVPIPQSVFDPNIAGTKNPFFPNSMRRPADLHASTNAAPSIGVSSFHLVGLSGSADSRLAMINHRTFGVGEALEVTTTSGVKATIRVLQIKELSVVIRVLTPPQPDLIELSLRKGAQ